MESEEYLTMYKGNLKRNTTSEYDNIQMNLIEAYHDFTLVIYGFSVVK